MVGARAEGQLSAYVVRERESENIPLSVADVISLHANIILNTQQPLIQASWQQESRRSKNHVQGRARSLL